MAVYKKLVSTFYRRRSKWWRDNRMLFPSPAEVRFIQIMGGRVVIIERIKHPKTKFPMVIVLSLGKILTRENFKREVRVGSKLCDFGNDLKTAIEIDGRYFHDIIEQVERDEYFTNYGWRVLHIEASKLWREPSKIQQMVLEFLA